MNLKQYLKKAQKEKWALGQFNFCSLEQLRGIILAAKELKKPIILGTSESESGYLGLKEIFALVEISKARYKVKAFLNFDHGKDVKKIKEAIDLGYSAVHFDGSGLSLRENIKITKKLADYAHKKNVLIEGELGIIRGESISHKKKTIINQEDLTSPEDVEEFVRKTKIDSLAVSVGNFHGLYSNFPKIDFSRLEKISKKTKSFLVLHGGSGIADNDIRRAINLGIVKININTELRLTWRESLEKVIKRNPEEIKPYKIMPEIVESIKKKVKEKITLFSHRE